MYGKTRKTKAIAYAYPTSENAKKLGFELSGCWHIQETLVNIEGSGQCRTYLPHDAEGFDKPDHSDLIALYNETKADMCPYFKQYGNKAALDAIRQSIAR